MSGGARATIEDWFLILCLASIMTLIVLVIAILRLPGFRALALVPLLGIGIAAYFRSRSTDLVESTPLFKQNFVESLPDLNALADKLLLNPASDEVG